MRLIPILLIFASLSVAANRPNFSGDWKMNPDKSQFGQLPRPVEYERKIDQKDAVIHMSVRQVTQTGDQTVNLTLRTDGRETSNVSPTGEAKTTGRWIGRDLQLTTTRQVEGGEAVSQDTWSLSADGKTLTCVTLMKTPRGNIEVRMVLDRQ